MEQKKIEHITLHLMVFSTIVVIGVLARQTALHYGWDEFSSYLILLVCSIVMGAIYLNLQMAFSQILSPAIEKCFMRFECYRSKIVVVEEYPEPIEDAVDVEPIVSEPTIEVETTSDTSEEVSTPMSSETDEREAKLPKEGAPPSIEEPNQPSEYEVLRANAIAEKERASQERLDRVITYTKRTLVSYLDEKSLHRLCGYVTEYYLSESQPKVEPIKLCSQLKTIDAMHFGWNIGKAFSKPRLQTATFIKRVFAHTLRDVEISTIERKMSHTESECKIRLNGNILREVL
ncbi:mobilization protein [Bacteroides clarus]|uniref:Mobilization protein n=1 Tax=Bacteroides clarus TaxID=626929 RepID=A0A412N6I0_9BACE|nr:mobilization protein [Bacteroides clarus]RGT34243.1 mobilization protein [Bacteroides clarus]